MKPLNMLFAGVGGQGILFASKIFFEAAMAKGLKVMGAETHGMSQRGGSVVSHFKMGDQTSAMVIPETADVLVALEPTEGLRTLEFLRPGGIYMVNAPDLDHLPQAVADFFDDNGIPWCADPENILVDNVVITLTLGSGRRDVTLQGINGRVTVQ